MVVEMNDDFASALESIRGYASIPKDELASERTVGFLLGRFLLSEKWNLERQIQIIDAKLKVDNVRIEMGDGVEKAKSRIERLTPLREGLVEKLASIARITREHYTPGAKTLMDGISITREQ